jgi:Leucine-rich repeat (LRR) protein
VLDLADNRLGGVQEITLPTSLIELRLGGNRLTALPPGIERLTRLRKLNLRNNRLTSVLPEITSLAQLRRRSAISPP